MNFNAPLLKPLRLLLFPFSLVYGSIIWLRNRLFDRQVLRSTSFDLPVICIGNLSAGGTGKSPMIEYLVRQLSTSYQVAVLSRGYKRKTKGYRLATEQDTAVEIGDEPLQFRLKFPQLTVAVGEERALAIPHLLQDRPGTEVILLDDAFQHRAVRAGLNILLTDYNNRFTKDWFLPAGNLRDSRSGYKRADVLVVTKCPDNLTEEAARAIEQELSPLPHQQVFFTKIGYETPYHILTKELLTPEPSLQVLLVTGIAQPAPLLQYLESVVMVREKLLYGDHHDFSMADWQTIQKKLGDMPEGKKVILTTEKDAARLLRFKQELAGWPVYVIPVGVRFLFNKEMAFKGLISKFMER